MVGSHSSTVFSKPVSVHSLHEQSSQQWCDIWQNISHCKISVTSEGYLFIYLKNHKSERSD